MVNQLRYWLSIVLTEIPDYWKKLGKSNDDWIYITNRKQKFIPEPGGIGLCLLSDFTSQLRAAQLFPSLSNKMFIKALESFEFNFSTTRQRVKKPNVSYIIGHRGKDKILHLKQVIQSIAAQCVDSIECIIIEQSRYPEVNDQLPDWVDYYHLEVEESELYNRSLSFNYGVQKAKGKYLVLHDNDLLIPSCYTISHLDIHDQGFDLVNLKRFIFGLDSADTQNVLTGKGIESRYSPEYILQNAKGGGSLFITKSGYERIGGFDERFHGWGGEDNELWQRAQILNIFPFGNLPLIHLWHTPQIDKRGGPHGGGQYTESVMDELSKIPIYNRIKSLTARK